MAAMAAKAAMAATAATAAIDTEMKDEYSPSEAWDAEYTRVKARLYWSRGGTYSKVLPYMQHLLPAVGACDNRALNSLRVLLNVYCDVYQNGGITLGTNQRAHTLCEPNVDSLGGLQKRARAGERDYVLMPAHLDVLMDDAIRTAFAAAWPGLDIDSLAGGVPLPHPAVCANPKYDADVAADTDIQTGLREGAGVPAVAAAAAGGVRVVGSVAGSKRGRVACDTEDVKHKASKVKTEA